MNKYTVILLAFIFINGMGSLISYLFPAVPKDRVLPIILWLNMVLALAFFLPNRVATFLTL
tara:strand:+ start:662 stop:844 length:183 start_codon:yes stop_codon:yes gene_type:complete